VSAAEVGRLYDTVLGRLPDVAGLSAWKSSMLFGQQNINQVANSFVSSDEFQARYGTLNGPDFINALYVNTLHRQPDTAGLTSWTNALTHGMARADVVLSFSESDEHIANTTMTLLSEGGMLFA
jgi:serralysin